MRTVNNLELKKQVAILPGATGLKITQGPKL